MQRNEHATALQHSNKAYGSDVLKMLDKHMNTELRLNNTRAGSKKHGKSTKDISITDLVKILTCQRIT